MAFARPHRINVIPLHSDVLSWSFSHCLHLTPEIEPANPKTLVGPTSMAYLVTCYVTGAPIDLTLALQDAFAFIGKPHK